ncbi:tyrosine-type recombinase/integrase [Methylohalobius crimeensis]|uniref:tyrosine-type recombinase/integrase n=1 Tax=Methylohalobius crimeensis TaxID=244365 RepID=UPI0003B6F0C2|nr:site-specific integrase [Methylohalobius crimeensis]
MASIRKRNTSDGQVSYHVQIRLKGYPPQTATFDRKTDAKKWAQATEAAIREGRHFKTAEARKHTLSELIDRYKRDVLPNQKPKHQANAAHALDWWKDRYGYLLLCDVTAAVVAEGKDALLNEPCARGTKRAPATVVKAMNCLSAAFTLAANEWGWLEENPCRKVKKPRVDNGRVRFLDDDERARLLEACKQSTNRYLYPIVLLGFSTGMRKSEILNLTWADVSLHGGFILLNETKNRERRRVPLVGAALEALKGHSKVRRLDTELLFPGRPTKPDEPPTKPMDIKRAWASALQRAEIDNFRFHDLRHSCASYLVMQGASLRDVAEILGHRTLQMTYRYSHLSETHLRGVLEDMAQKVF